MSGLDDSKEHRPERSAVFAEIGIEAYILDRDSLATVPSASEPCEDPTCWIEIIDGPIRWLAPLTMYSHWHFYAPDSRLEEYPDLDYAEVYSVRQRRFPVFGRVVGVEWRIYEPLPEDGSINYAVWSARSNDIRVSEALMSAGIHQVGVYVESGCWVIWEGDLQRPTRIKWNCYQEIARCLLAITIPPED